MTNEGQKYAAPEKSCCFSGHRNISEEEIRAHADSLEGLVRMYCAEGITNFYAGGAIGFDMLAGITVVNLRRELPDIRLTLAIPCRDHMKRWQERDIRLFGKLAERADEIVCLSEHYYPGCMLERNRYMVDRSRYLICYLRERGGGTYQTVSYAIKRGLNVKNLCLRKTQTEG